MKDLKFRAWLKNSNKMIGVEEISLMAQKQIAYDEIEYRYTDEKPFYYMQWVDFDDIELMQYTGLKDKNGVEIYDGDIVKVHYEYAYDGYVEGSTLCVVKHVDGWCRVIFQYLYDKDGNYYSVEDLDMNDVEIIGNVWEHKHLLGEQNDS